MSHVLIPFVNLQKTLSMTGDFDCGWNDERLPWQGADCGCTGLSDVLTNSVQ